MQLHELQVNRGLKSKKRVGRGGKKGTYSGRGMKGQKSRSGNNYEPIIRPLIKRYHKLKGSSYTSQGKLKIETWVNLSTIEIHFEADEVVSPQTLKEKSLITTYHKKFPKVKILARGDLTKALKFEKCCFSESAREKILKAGGSITDEKMKRGKKQKKQLTAEQLKIQKQKADKQAEKRRLAKKKASGKRKKEAAKKTKGGKK
jgi:large subunit ribosomal protein L15